MILIWKKGLLKSNYKITAEGRIVGNLKENILEKSAVAELFGNRYAYKTNGIFNQETEIYRTSDQKVLGRITYNTLKTFAQIEYQDRFYDWKTENWNHSKWRLYDENGSLTQYKGSSSRGELNTNINDDFLILTGLCIANYYWQNLVAIMMVLFIVYVIVLN